MGNKTLPSPQCLGGGKLTTLCSNNPNITISNRPFFPCKTLLVNWRKKHCLGLNSAARVWLSDVMRQSGGSSQGAALQGVVMGTEQVGHPPCRIFHINSGYVVAQNQCCSAAWGEPSTRLSLLEVQSEWNTTARTSLCMNVASLLLIWMEQDFTECLGTDVRVKGLTWKISAGTTVSFKSPLK